MRSSILLTCCVLLISTISFAQTRDSFDIATFQTPAGWTKQDKGGGVVLSTSDTKKGTFALITIYPSSAGTGNGAADFTNDWRKFVQEPLGVNGKPEMEPAKTAGGWQINSGGTSFESPDLGRAVILLNTFSGFGRSFSLTAIFNSQDNIAALESFLASIDLKKPQADVPAKAVAIDNAILGTWGQNLGAHMTYGDPVAASMAGYSKDQYTFNANGTFTFVSKTFRMGYDKIILVRENGTYGVNGTNLMIKPEKSVIQAWSKLNGGDKFGRLLTSQNRKLETVTYRYTKHYFSGIDQWNLVLQAENPTERDGPFSTLTLFTNAWYYKPISSNNPVIELPN